MKGFTVTLVCLLLISSGNAVVVDEDQGSRIVQESLDPNPDSWIVQFAPGTTGVATKATNIAKNRGGKVGAVYTNAIKGFVYKGKNIDGLSQNPNVISVTRDSVQTITAQSVPTGIKRVFATSKSYMTAATSSCFCDAVVAVIDTGVDFYNGDLRVNQAKSVDCTSGVCVNGGHDNHGHGTHVSGTIGAINNGQGVVGVCPGAEIWAVKVLNSEGRGYTSWILAGIDYVTKQNATVDVVNMSLGGSGCDNNYCAAITKAKNAGVAFAVAAGNSNATASGFSPACCADALTVSSLADSDGAAGSRGSTTCRGTKDDILSGFSNYGAGVNIAAPGECILSTIPNGGLGTMSGTSMACPHVAGALAILASKNHNGDVSTMYKTLTQNGNYGYTDKPYDTFGKEPLLDLTNITDATMTGTCSNNFLPAATNSPTKVPTKAPSLPTDAPIKNPTTAPTNKPTKIPTSKPTRTPTKRPTKSPTKVPTQACLVKGSLCSIFQPESCCSGTTCRLNNMRAKYYCN